MSSGIDDIEEEVADEVPSLSLLLVIRASLFRLIMNPIATPPFDVCHCEVENHSHAFLHGRSAGTTSTNRILMIVVPGKIMAYPMSGRSVGVSLLA